MNVPWMIARRYVRPRRLSVITIIGGVSVLGIIIGTAALVIVTSLFNGFRGVANDLMIGFGPHLVVTPEHGLHFAHPSAEGEIASILKHSVGAIAVTQASTSKLVLSSAGKTGVADGVALQDPSSPVFKGLARSIIFGRYAFTIDSLPGIIISSGVAENLQLRLGDTVRLIAPTAIERAVITLSMPSGYPVLVAGVFQSNGVREADGHRIYLAGDVMKIVAGSSARSELFASVTAPRSLPDMQVQSLMPPGVRCSTWEDLNRGLVDTMRLESVGSFIVLMLIVLVASFNVLVSLTIGVVEKRRDIGVLIGMGLTPHDVRRIYLLQGLAIGVVSVVLGMIVGLGICWGQITFRWIAFDMSQGFLVPALPLEVHALDVVIIATVTLILAAVAALYPATRAARTTLADALRAE